MPDRSLQLIDDNQFLISGANAYIGSHICDVLLQDGYRVRGTVRDVAKNAWLQELFDTKYGEGKFELVQVKDISTEGAFDEALQGVDGFAHVASVVTLSPDPNAVVTPVVDAAKAAMASVLKAKGLKTYVLTSSSTAATNAYPNKELHIDADMWNDADVKAAWAPPPYGKERGYAVYAASKTEGERESWKAYKAAGPDVKVSFNAVLPNANFGPILDPKHQHGSTASWVRSILSGGFDGIKSIPPREWLRRMNSRTTISLHATQNILCMSETQQEDTQRC